MPSRGLGRVRVVLALVRCPRVPFAETVVPHTAPPQIGQAGIRRPEVEALRHSRFGHHGGLPRLRRAAARSRLRRSRGPALEVGFWDSVSLSIVPHRPLALGTIGCRGVRVGLLLLGHGVADRERVLKGSQQCRWSAGFLLSSLEPRETRPL